MVLPLLTAIFAPFVFLPIALLFGKKLRAQTGWVAIGAPLLSVSLLAWMAINAPSGSQEVVEIPWVPSLGLNLTFLVDGLSLFFGMVVSGMGALIVYYAKFYLDDHYEDHGHFYAYLLLFMGAMLGTVLAGNLLLLFIFWEITGIASFLLIGFLHGKENSRQGAQMALIVTATTGIALFAGVILLGLQAGTYDLATILSGKLTDTSRTAMTVAFVLMAIGAMGKSAQFPFHFWLPNAMAAPTPVSAYLHSATMVKLGIFLVARIFPVFREVELWTPWLVTTGFVTMAVAGFLALLSHDLKAVLAYSTVTTLGYLIGFYGLSSPAGAQGDLLHISSHVFFKGSLFMIAGIIDHAAGTRDIRQLGGLRRRLPWLTILTVICAASMAGFPGTLGFISKEYMLKAQVIFFESGHTLGLAALVLAAIALTFKVAFSLRLVGHVFGGKETDSVKQHFHAPSIGMLVPPTILAAASLIFGFKPMWLANALATLSVPGLHHATPLVFKAFPDHWALEVAISTGVLAGGILLYLCLPRKVWATFSIPGFLRLDTLFFRGMEQFSPATRRLAEVIRVDRPFDQLGIVMGFTVILVGSFIGFNSTALLPAFPTLADFHPLRTFVGALIAVATLMVMALRTWTGQLISMSIIGFMITFYFVLFRAPDLAMTQILVESATLLLVLLLLSRFPQSAEAGEHETRSSVSRVVLRAVIAVGMGTLAMFVSVMALSPRATDTAGKFYLANTVELAHGTNAVNTLLVDFRGFDTLFEITVLVIAALGAIGLLMRHRRTRDEYEAGNKNLPGYINRAKVQQRQSAPAEDRS